MTLGGDHHVLGPTPSLSGQEKGWRPKCPAQEIAKGHR